MKVIALFIIRKLALDCWKGSKNVLFNVSKSLLAVKMNLEQLPHAQITVMSRITLGNNTLGCQTHKSRASLYPI